MSGEAIEALRGQIVGNLDPVQLEHDHARDLLALAEIALLAVKWWERGDDPDMLTDVADNSWPGGVRHAMHQSEHEAWNARHFPGTRQLCERCDDPTGRCEDDSLYADDDRTIGPLCERCWNDTTLTAVEQQEQGTPRQVEEAAH